MSRLSLVIAKSQLNVRHQREMLVKLPYSKAPPQNLSKTFFSLATEEGQKKLSAAY